MSSPIDSFENLALNQIVRRSYFNLNDNALIIREEGADYEIFRLLNRGGWRENPDVACYFYNGEPGAEEISRAEAEDLAKKLGGSLSPH